ncbi:Dabb family protein [Clavibacter michiganensis subsp. phaseoli]|uniref:Dabb family protein n=2 Tax=Clavibacter phaseoli TaxID=1734031 RepID=A0A8I0SAJ2_9MICO|nr:Dabb family protein [Clavibacter phaseoli]
MHAPGSAKEEGFLADAHRILSGIPGVRDFTVNRQVSAKSALSWQFSMVFADRATYAAYDAHPEHTAFVKERWMNEVNQFQEYDFTAR